MMPKPARLAALIEGRVDLVISMLVPRAGDRARVDFSRPYYALGAAVMHLADARPVRAPGDLAGLRLGFIARNQARPAASLGPGFGQPARRASFASFDEAAAAIERGDVDGLYSEALNIDAWLAAHPGRFVRSPALTREPVAVAVAKGNADLLGEVDALIADLAASGGLADLQLAHGLAAPAEVRRRPAAAPGP
jgi:ABC-type amino acid transport substrate-binding protein